VKIGVLIEKVVTHQAENLINNQWNDVLCGESDFLSFSSNGIIVLSFCLLCWTATRDQDTIIFIK